MIESGDYVRVTAYDYHKPVKPATRESMELMMLADDPPDPTVAEKIERLKRSAKGLTDASYVGQVTRIVDGIAVIQSRGNVEHAKVEDCQKIKICRMCYREEAEYGSEFCKKANCAKKRGHR